MLRILSNMKRLEKTAEIHIDIVTDLSETFNKGVI
jgi:hypothetical protein